MTEKWYSKTEKEILDITKSDAVQGLNPRTARLRLRRQGENNIFKIKTISPIKYASEVFLDFTSILLLITAFIASQFEGQKSAVYIYIMIIVSCIFEIITYVKAQRILEVASAHSIPRSRIIRGGKILTINSRGIVRGDIMLLSKGDIVTCDARILSSNSLKVSENYITENYVSVLKKATTLPSIPILPPHRQSNMIFAGSTIISGSCRAIAVDIGEDTIAFMKTGGLSFSNHEKLPILKSLKKYCSTISLFMIFCVMLIAVLDIAIGLQTRGLSQVFLTAMSLAVASMSEFFASIGYIIIACGVVGAGQSDVYGYGKLSKNKSVVIKNIISINKMRTIDYLLLSDACALYSSIVEINSFLTNGEQVNNTNFKSSEFEKLMSYAVLSTGHINSLNTNYLMPLSVSATSSSHNEAELIQYIYSKNFKHKKSNQFDKFLIVEHFSKRMISKYETSLVFNNQRVKFEIYVHGAIGEILADCTSYSKNNEIIPITPEIRLEFFEAAVALEKKCCHVIAIARRDSPYNNLAKITIMQNNLCFEGFFAVEEKITEGATEIIEQCKNAGIVPVLITEDTGLMGKSFAEYLGFIDNLHDYVTISDFSAFDNELLKMRCMSIGTCAGFENRDLLKFIKALKENKKVVGYIGGSADEADLIYEVDVGFACLIKPEKSIDEVSKIGIKGMKNTEAENVRINADVLINEASSKNGGIVDAVKAISYAKSIFVNMRHAASYLITSQTARIILVLFTVIFGFEIMTAPQILLWGLIFDFLAVLLFAFEKPSAYVLSCREGENEIFSLKNIARPSIFGIFWAISTLAIPQIISYYYKPLGMGEMSAFVFISSVSTIMVVVSESMHDTTLFKKGTCVNAVYIFFIGIVIFTIISCLFGGFASEIFGTGMISYTNSALAFVPCMLMFLLYEVIKHISPYHKF